MRRYKKTFPVDLYKRGVMVFLGTREAVKRFITEEYDDVWDDESEEILDRTSAVTFRLSSDALIFSSKPITDGVMVHEIGHAAKHLLRIVGVEDEEAECYLIEYLYDKILPWFHTTSFSRDASPSRLSLDASSQSQEK